MYGTQLLGHLGDHAVNLLPAGDVGHEREDTPVGLAAQLAGSCLQIKLRLKSVPLTLVSVMNSATSSGVRRDPCRPSSTRRSSSWREIVRVFEHVP
jgi:hypothetical protein